MITTNVIKTNGMDIKELVEIRGQKIRNSNTMELILMSTGKNTDIKAYSKRCSTKLAEHHLLSIQFFKHFVDGISVSALALKRVSQSNEALTNQPVFFGRHPHIDIIFMFEHLPFLLAL